ncbi:hypothetical protein HaLaN_25042, partial [Haematococcus lacustris]
MEEPLYIGVVPWDRTSSLSAGLPSMVTNSLFASQLVAKGAWEHHCSPPASFRSLPAGSVFARKEVRQEAIGIAPTNADSYHATQDLR